VSLKAAETTGIRSAVAGQADILLVPDLESGNMIAKQLAYLADALSAGIVLGARVPIALTSRGDDLRSWLDRPHAASVCERLELVGETAFAYCRDPQPVIDLVERDAGLRYLQRRANLEDVFLKLTGRELRD